MRLRLCVVVYLRIEIIILRFHRVVKTFALISVLIFTFYIINQMHVHISIIILNLIRIIFIILLSGGHGTAWRQNSSAYRHGDT